MNMATLSAATTADAAGPDIGDLASVDFRRAVTSWRFQCPHCLLLCPTSEYLGIHVETAYCSRPLVTPGTLDSQDGVASMMAQLQERGRCHRILQKANEALRAAAVRAGVETETYEASRKIAGKHEVLRVVLGAATTCLVRDLSEREQQLCERMMVAQEADATGVHYSAHASGRIGSDSQRCRKTIVWVGNGDNPLELLRLGVGNMSVYFEGDVEVGWETGRDLSEGVVQFCPTMSAPDFATQANNYVFCN